MEHIGSIPRFDRKRHWAENWGHWPDIWHLGLISRTLSRYWGHLIEIGDIMVHGTFLEMFLPT